MTVVAGCCMLLIADVAMAVLHGEHDELRGVTYVGAVNCHNEIAMMVMMSIIINTLMVVVMMMMIHLLLAKGIVCTVR